MELSDLKTISTKTSLPSDLNGQYYAVWGDNELDIFTKEWENNGEFLYTLITEGGPYLKEMDIWINDGIIYDFTEYHYERTVPSLIIQSVDVTGVIIDTQEVNDKFWQYIIHLNGNEVLLTATGVYSIERPKLSEGSFKIKDKLI